MFMNYFILDCPCLPMSAPRDTWPDFALYRPYPPVAVLRAWIADTRAITWAWLGDLADDATLGPRAALLNPPRWEVAHLVLGEMATA
jgi:hypothetical protein